MELYKVIFDDGVIIPVTKENRNEFLSDPEGFKLRYVEERRRKLMSRNETKAFIEELNEEEMKKFQEALVKVMKEEESKKNDKK